jgi:hypothetical protein
MPQVGFEHTITVYERAKIVHALDCAATVIGVHTHTTEWKYDSKHNAKQSEPYFLWVTYDIVNI